MATGDDLNTTVWEPALPGAAGSDRVFL